MVLLDQALISAAKAKHRLVENDVQSEGEAMKSEGMARQSTAMQRKCRAQTRLAKAQHCFATIRKGIAEICTVLICNGKAWCAMMCNGGDRRIVAK